MSNDPAQWSMLTLPILATMRSRRRSWCDVAQELYFLSSGGIDTEASVLGTVNVLDLVRVFDEDGDYMS
jgi:hypothetical protein